MPIGTICSDGPAGLNDAADGVDGERVHDAGHRRPDLRALGSIARGLERFALFRQQPLDLFQIVGGLLRIFLVGLRKARFGFHARGFEFLHRRLQVADLAVEPRFFTLQRPDALLVDVALFEQGHDGGQFLGVQLALLDAGVELGGDTLQFAFGLGQTLVQHFELAEVGSAPCLEKQLLCGERGGGRRLVAIDVGRELEAVLAVAFGDEARFLDRVIGDLGGHGRESGARLRIVETHQHIAGLYRIAVADEDFRDDAAFQMLDALVLALDGDRAARDHGTVDRHDGGNATEARTGARPPSCRRRPTAPSSAIR